MGVALRRTLVRRMMVIVIMIITAWVILYVETTTASGEMETIAVKPQLVLEVYLDARKKTTLITTGLTSRARKPAGRRSALSSAAATSVVKFGVSGNQMAGAGLR